MFELAAERTPDRIGTIARWVPRIAVRVAFLGLGPQHRLDAACRVVDDHINRRTEDRKKEAASNTGGAFDGVGGIPDSSIASTSRRWRVAAPRATKSMRTESKRPAVNARSAFDSSVLL